MRSTSVVLWGVLKALGLQGRGHCSRHSGWVTTLHSWHRRYTFPNLVLLPQGWQNSDLMTCEVQRTASWTALEQVRLAVVSQIRLQINIQSRMADKLKSGVNAEFTLLNLVFVLTKSR